MQQHVAVTGARDPVCHDTSERCGAIVLEAHRECAKGFGHRAGIDHGGDRHTERDGKIGARGIAVIKAHRAFDQDQVSGTGGLVQQRLAALPADHPEIDVLDGVAAGGLEDHRVEKVRSSLEHAHAAPVAGVKTRQCGGDRGLALPRSNAGDEQGRARHNRHRQILSAQNSTPGMAFTPDLNACLTRVMSVTVSAASINSGGAPRPVMTTCCIGGRVFKSATTLFTSR